LPAPAWLITLVSRAGNGKELARIGAGSCFGELALLNDSPRAANVMALKDSQVLTSSPYAVFCIGEGTLAIA